MLYDVESILTEPTILTEIDRKRAVAVSGSFSSAAWQERSRPCNRPPPCLDIGEMRVLYSGMGTAISPRGAS